jgi:NAD(P)-dependent dehydrogenase (short-subunit alcohol dehydrogenase family)
MVKHAEPMTGRSEMRIALVTGGNRGLGRALCRELASHGITVFLSGRDPELVGKAATELADEGLPVWPIVLDITNDASVASAVSAILDRHGRIDILVNNAAIVMDRGQKAANPDLHRVAETIDTNLLGAWRCVGAVSPHMVKAGYGRIVNVSTHLASSTRQGAHGGVSYRVSKAALNALTRILAAELDGTGVLVNAASPGKVNTRMAMPNIPTIEAQQAAAEMLWLATLPQDGPTGGFWHERQRLPW